MTPAPRQRADQVARIVTGVLSIALGAMVLRVVQLQLHPSTPLQDHMQSRITRTSLPARRGEIADRLGRPMATSEFGYRAFIDPTELDDPDEAIARLADALHLPADQLGAKIMSRVAENKRRAPATEADAAAPQGKPGLGEVVSRLFAAFRSDAPERPDSMPWDDESDSLKPIHYVRISGILEPDALEALKKLKLKGLHLEQRPVRENPAGDLGASIVGKVSADAKGIIGAEHSRENTLVGESGNIDYLRDSHGRPLWMSPGGYMPAHPGQDVRLSLDLELQRITIEELRRGMQDCDSAGGRAIIMDPRTGEILAMADLVRPVPDAVPFPWADATGPGRTRRSDLLYEPEPGAGPHQRYITLKPDLGRLIHPALARNRCVEDVYEPGSTFKPFVWSTITELGLAKTAETFDTEGGHWRTSYGRWIRDVVKRPTMTWAEVLVNSSNIGMSKGGERMSFDQLSATVHRFGFGSRTHIGLQGETAGIVTPRKAWSKYTQTSVCFGHEIAVTPVQMARAFCVFARSGELAGTLPTARLTAADSADPGADSLAAGDAMLHRVLRPDIALLTRSLMRDVATSMEAKMAASKEHPETGWRYGLFGKSGTAEIPLGKAPPGKRRPPGNKGYYDRQYNASFIGAGPIETPRLVILVVIDDPGPERVRSNTYYGALTAGPVVRRVMERGLAYLGVPPAPAPARSAPAAGPMAD